MSGPMSPEEVTTRKASMIPEVVFEVFNELIARGWNGRETTIRQDEVVARLEAAGIASSRIFAEHLLDVEDAYRALGWKVVYDKPAYCETYPATFTFSKK